MVELGTSNLAAKAYATNGVVEGGVGSSGDGVDCIQLTADDRVTLD